MARAIRLDISTPARILFEGRDTFRIVIAAADAVDMPLEIFGYQRTLIDPYSGRTEDEFQFVCSAFDLSIYPANAPNQAQIPAYFRKNIVDILVPGLTIADQTIAMIKDQVCGLRSQLDTLDRLGTPVSYWCGTPPAEPTDSQNSLDSA